jgi:glutathione S-transferase
MVIKLYTDIFSQPCRACIIFCKMSGIDHEQINVSIQKGENRTVEYLAINPFGSVPSMVDTINNVTLIESSSIVRYLAK